MTLDAVRPCCSPKAAATLRSMSVATSMREGDRWVMLPLIRPAQQTQTPLGVPGLPVALGGPYGAPGLVGPAGSMVRGSWEG
jgi:hypothetical protein